MKKATPSNGTPLPQPKNRKERIKYLLKLQKIEDDKFLEKAYLFLSQLKRAGIGTYETKENEIKGLSSDDISLIFHLLNQTYSGSEYENNKEYSVFYISVPFISEENFVERTFKIGKYFELALSEIKEILENKNIKKEPSKINGLIQPIRWQNITIIYNGENIKIKQDDTTLGEYNLEDLGMPKVRKTKLKGVRQLFTSLFFPETYKENSVLLGTNYVNQKNKSNLSKILKKVFETNVDPIYIDTKTKKYIPYFKISLSEDYAINDFPSGIRLYDKDGALPDDFTD